MSRLQSFAGKDEGGLVVLYGRRRIGKTRLLLEWSKRQQGLYTVADQSAPDVQRRYFAEAVARILPGFDEAEYPDWRRLLNRLARDAKAVGWTGPLIFDELPYLVVSTPELASVLQHFVDHEAREAKLKIAVAGSSQRMMHGLVLDGDAPLYGRARELMEIGALDPVHLAEVFDFSGASAAERAVRQVELFTAWGGVPRYWELAADVGGDVEEQLDQLVLDPLGPLHLEPDRLLIEELPPAMETRPLLDAVGGGAHRLSEIAGRLGRPATSMARPIDRLIGMGLLRREVPFGEAKTSKKSLYKIADPFIRLWFRTVAPHRALLASGQSSSRLRLLRRFWPELAAQAFEDLCRLRLPYLTGASPLADLGPWGPAGRWWRGSEPEWDLVAESVDGDLLLLGEVKWSKKSFQTSDLEHLARRLLARKPPNLPGRLAELPTKRALFVPATADSVSAGGVSAVGDVLVVSVAELLAAQNEDLRAPRAG